MQYKCNSISLHAYKLSQENLLLMGFSNFPGDLAMNDQLGDLAMTGKVTCDGNQRYLSICRHANKLHPSHLQHPVKLHPSHLQHPVKLHCYGNDYLRWELSLATGKVTCDGNQQLLRERLPATGTVTCDGNKQLRRERSLATGINSCYGNDYLRRESCRM